LPELVGVEAGWQATALRPTARADEQRTIRIF
jgi:hypothetical protein